MLKSFTLTLLAIVTIGSAIAQDFRHRDSRQRRQADHRRGFRDGRDCTVLANRVAESACSDARGGTSYYTDHGSCARIMQFVAQDPEAFVAEILRGNGWDRNLGSSPGTEHLAREAAACQGNRESSFDRDAERDSNEFHAEEERRMQEENRPREVDSAGNDCVGAGCPNA